MKHKPGFSLIETMIAVMALSFTVLVFGAIFPAASRMRQKSENVARATTLAHQKLEQLRGLDYGSLNRDDLHTAGIIDASPTSSPFSITAASGLASALPQGAGTLALGEVNGGDPDLTQATVEITWQEANGQDNSVRFITYLANRGIRVDSVN
jgi:hypothetical protein